MSKNTSLNVIVGQNVRKYRKKLGLNQDEFADKCGLHRTYVGAVERGERNVTLETLAKLATASGASPIQLLISHAEV